MGVGLKPGQIFEPIDSTMIALIGRALLTRVNQEIFTTFLDGKDGLTELKISFKSTMIKKNAKLPRQEALHFLNLMTVQLNQIDSIREHLVSF